MSLYLALDTATERATLALGTPASPGPEVVLAGRRNLSRDIERVAASLLRERGVTPGDLTGVIVADGPGGFTGLRIGIAFAKGVSRALGIPLLAAPSLMGAARAAATGPEPVVAVYDALRGEVYRAAYGFAADGSVRTVSPPAVVPAAGVRDGPPPATEAQASARALVRLVGAPGGGAIVDAASWEPAYGRPAEAEARRLAREGGTAAR